LAYRGPLSEIVRRGGRGRRTRRGRRRKGEKKKDF
jgi:hypothetical protein